MSTVMWHNVADDLDGHTAKYGHIVESHQKNGGMETLGSVQDCTPGRDPVNPRSLNARQSEDWIVVMSGKTKRVRPRVKDSHSLETDKRSNTVRFGMTKGYD